MIRFLGLTSSTTIRMVSVDLGIGTVAIPVADIHGEKPGPTLVITAGIDGDEYAGIEAAYALIEQYSPGHFSGRVVIVPIVNISGFYAECSENALDGAFPKYSFPGKANGSPTERLMHWLSESYVRNAQCWLDLHSGNLAEGLHPFVWLYRTGVSEVDAITDAVCRAAGRQSISVLHEKASWGSKQNALAKNGCAYIMPESGGRGSRKQEDIERHVVLARTVMQILGMVEEKAATLNQEEQCYYAAEYLQAPFEGIWRPEALVSDDIKKGQLIGRYMHLDETNAREIVAPCNGRRLWWKETMAMRKGDVLCAIAKIRP